MLSALLSLGLLAAALGLALGYAAVRLKPETDPVADRVDALLPQTQCGQCGYPGCRPYAQAIAVGEAPINRCPPGGGRTVQALADLLGREAPRLDERYGIHKGKRIARIDEDGCIGCTLCLKACPVDAIVGAARQMHTVLARECTGCELCLAPCPVDCIELVPIEPTPTTWRWPAPSLG